MTDSVPPLRRVAARSCARPPAGWLPAALLTALSAVLCGLAAGPAHADLQIDITKGVSDPIPIAIVPFARAVPADGGFDVAAVVQHDLDGSGRFRTMQRRDMLANPTRAADVLTGDWKAAGNDYVVVGRLLTGVSPELIVECDLVSVLTGQALASQRYTATAATLRNAAHQISDFVYEKILGTRGAFSTRIAYISVEGQPPAQHYQLIVADADGENPKTVLESGQPLMSPAWSPDGQWLAYVSFENRVSSIYVQRVRTGERRLVSARAGVNGAPAWAPDGNRLALTLSGTSGNLDIYTLDLRTQMLVRLTEDPAVDTEPAWSPDGSAIYFTSDRAGSPQIYRIETQQPTRVQRITFGSAYSARARISADGRKLAFVTREGSNYRIAVQDLPSGTITVLSHGALDESPSFAPNGAVVIYAGRDAEQGLLETVSVDGLVTQRLKSDRGEVREPVWGPFAP
jgi:TolB protein